ncbi:bombyxin B-1 homolog [Parasteatoda tepidariorum]|uniref:bombyxin B-1 homolog n=1 Tax=Parasteatoda tepidariorum TaxID=114398 RepID=UPI001C71AA91|nr:bombyxin B-1 homolog [Parasteatoda tepidariorum]
MLKVVILFLWLAANLTDTVVSAPPTRMKRDNIRLCGKLLVDTLSQLCHGEYYDPNDIGVISKRSYAPNPLDSYPQWLFSSLTSREQNDPVQSVPGASIRHGRQVRGVVDECCLRSCSVLTLLSYCRTT